MKLYIEPIHHKEKAYYLFDKRITVSAGAGESLRENVRQLHNFFNQTFESSVDIDTIEYIDEKPIWNWQTNTRESSIPERQWSYRPGENVFYIKYGALETLKFWYPNSVQGYY